jgi:hypothetical protein
LGGDIARVGIVRFELPLSRRKGRKTALFAG